MIVAQVLGGYSIAQVCIAIILIAAVVGILLLTLRHFGVAIPPVVVQIFWIVVVAFLAILAIRFLLAA